ncbi:pre-toxin TG domain-containing protein [Halobacillus ihumii]|uniref:pre-toxin TG domain-containing protein n=1 Tax=Halobacillus ihumii TaxID=2686092 RepID=UPI0013D1FE2C|nr:pre-toxin TG domain-containing protein [Halobacillus ihumii]
MEIYQSGQLQSVEEWKSINQATAESLAAPNEVDRFILEQKSLSPVSLEYEFTSGGVCTREEVTASSEEEDVVWWKKTLSFGLDFIPIVGNIKAAIETKTGENLITGVEYEGWERTLLAASIIGGGYVKLAGKGAKGVKSFVKVDDTKLTMPKSTYEERLAQTPVSNGKWTDQRGESTFISYDDGARDILNGIGKDGIDYADAIPDFSVVSRGDVQISKMSTDRRINFRKADELLAGKLGVTRKEIVKIRKTEKLTWHELNDMTSMQLVPSTINSKFGHLGGVAEVKKLLDKKGE